MPSTSYPLAGWKHKMQGAMLQVMQSEALAEQHRKMAPGTAENV